MFDEFKDKAFLYEIMAQDYASRGLYPDEKPNDFSARIAGNAFRVVTNLTLRSPESLDDLKYFPNLEYLTIHSTKVRDYKPLREVKKLQELALLGCSREDIEKINGLKLKAKAEFLHEDTDLYPLERAELHPYTMNFEGGKTPEELISEAHAMHWRALAVIDFNSAKSFGDAFAAAIKNNFYGNTLKLIYGLHTAVFFENNGFIFPVTLDILAKNQAGISELYEIIDYLHTSVWYEAIGMEATGFLHIEEFVRRTRSWNLLFGMHPDSAEKCIKATGSAAKDIFKHFDYIEISAFIEKRETEKIIDFADSLGIPACAVGNVHYTKADDRYSSSLDWQKPVKNKNDSLRHLGNIIDLLQYYFSLSEITAYKVVLVNPNKIADMVENISSLPPYPGTISS